MSKIHTHYDNLKIARNAPDALIKAAYKLLLQQHHPDKVEVAKQAEALRITHIIRGSYDVLSDPVQRAEHDAWIKTQEAQSRSHKPEQPDINVNEAREKEEFRRREAEKVKEEDAKNKTGCLPWIIGVGVISFLVVGVVPNPSYQPASAPDTYVQPAQANRYHDNGDGTVKDVKTNLEWMRCSLGQNPFSPTCEGEAKEYSWKDALVVGKKFQFANHKDWRVPTNEELRSLIYCSDNKNKTLGKEEAGYICTGSPTSPTINTTYFPNTPSLVFWSSSPVAGDSSGAWSVGFSYGYSGSNYKGNNNGVRLVRG